MSHEETTVILTNTGPTCRLSGYPDLAGWSSSRGWVTLAVLKSGTYFGNLIPADVAHGGHGRLILGTGTACPVLNQPSHAAVDAAERANTYTGIAIILPHGRGTVTDRRATFDVACGLSESQLKVRPPPPAIFRPPPGSAASLTASVALPAIIRSGRLLKYSISLHNPTNTVVRWRTCPGHTELIFLLPSNEASKKIQRTYGLNCAGARPVEPGRTEVFAMQLFVPKVTSTTMAKFAWSLNTGNGPFVGRALTVLAAD
jgi:hypothetical protein